MFAKQLRTNGSVLFGQGIGAAPRRRGERTPRLRMNRATRLVFTCALSIVLLLAARPVLHLATTAMSDRDERRPTPAGFVDDASRLDRTPVAEVWPVPSDRVPSDRDDAERQLRDLLLRARATGKRVSIAGARHSMGGHTIYPDGIVVDMRPFDRMELDERTNVLRVQSGALWAQVIPYLDARGRSVAVMQSNNSFTVGGSLSVNCHGWQTGSAPIASTVESLEVMTADGSVVRCGRTENAELFGLVLGGYGLFGVMLEADLRVVANERYRFEQFDVASEDYAATFEREVVGRDGAAMAYGRLSVAPSGFLREGVLTVFTRDARGEIPPLGDARLLGLKRTIFRGSVGSDYGKELRWRAERDVGEHLAADAYSRNQLLDEGVETYENRTATSTDVLHEYFVPKDELEPFLARVREIVPRRGGDLLNVTVRDVREDEDTVLRYARGDRFGLVMLFNQAATPEAEDRMRAMTREMIDAALDVGGTYYLPYRLHATPEQFARAYPQAERFFALKRKYDPEGIFQNEFSRAYGVAPRALGAVMNSANARFP